MLDIAKVIAMETSTFNPMIPTMSSYNCHHVYADYINGLTGLTKYQDKEASIANFTQSSNYSFSSESIASCLDHKFNLIADYEGCDDIARKLERIYYLDPEAYENSKFQMIKEVVTNSSGIIPFQAAESCFATAFGALANTTLTSSECNDVYRDYIEEWTGYDDVTIDSRFLQKSNYSFPYGSLVNCLVHKSASNDTFDDCEEMAKELEQVMLVDPGAYGSSLFDMMKETVLNSSGLVSIEAVSKCLDNAFHRYDYWATSNIAIAFYVLNCLIALFGMLGNAALFKTYLRKDRSLRFNQLMIILATFDFLYLSFLVVTGAVDIAGYDRTGKLRIGLSFNVDGFFGCSVYTAISLCLERYLILCHKRYFFKTYKHKYY